MNHFGGPAYTYVYVGDNPAKDFVGARALGWRTIRIRRAAGEHSLVEAQPGYEADQEIADLGELRRLAKSDVSD
jgi:putative hydrolase of the HAD superfamily